MHIEGEKAEKEFIRLFGKILSTLNILQSFDEFEGKEIIDLGGEFLDYRGFYNEMHEKYRPKESDAVNINDDLVFEMELMKTVEINIDYILFLVSQLTGEENSDREIIIKVMKSVEASPDLRDKGELIREFIRRHTPENSVHDQWQKFVEESQRKEIEAIIADENLRREKALEFLRQTFRDAEVREEGTALAGILPPMGLFGSAGERRAEKKKKVLWKIKDFFNRFYDISGGNFYG